MAETTGSENTQKPSGGEPPADDFVITEHTLESASGTLRYTATAGRMVIFEEGIEDGRSLGSVPKAQVFLTSYTVVDDDGRADPSRPVLFAFNGGPGSSSVWLHLGLFGPRRVVANDVDERTPAPYGLVDNPETTLAQADLVFIDPITTGYSRVVEGETASTYHGFSADRDVVGEAIRLWLSRNRRWLSPKLLAGESYGTTRAAALAGHLAKKHGIAFNGIVLISAVLDFATIVFSEGNEAPYVHYLPTFAAVAHYHGKHPGRDLAEVVEEAEEFAAGPFSRALARGNRLSQAERDENAAKLASLIGLSTEFVSLADLRVDEFMFFAELLRERRLRVGRLDSRFTAHPGQAHAEVLGDDPSYPFIHYPYTAGINHYLRAELGYETDLEYEIISERVHPWSYREFENRSVTSADDLASALRSNPDLKVYVAFGYHDSATPFAASEHVLAHLRVPAEVEQRIVRFYYEAGHMMYVHQPSRVRQSADIAAFIGWSAGTASRPASRTPHGDADGNPA